MKTDQKQETNSKYEAQLQEANVLWWWIEEYPHKRVALNDDTVPNVVL